MTRPQRDSHTGGTDFAPRIPPVLRAAVLIVTGIAVTFTATLHESLDFTRNAIALSLLALAAVQLIVLATPRLRPFQSQGGLASLFLETVVGLFVIIGQPDTHALTHCLALWAVISAVVIAVSRHRETRTSDGWAHAVLLVGLAVAVELTRGDAVMLIGFFGAYAMIAGVFQAIAAADRTPQRSAPGDKPRRSDAEHTPPHQPPRTAIHTPGHGDQT